MQLQLPLTNGQLKRRDFTLEQARSWMLRDESSMLRVIGINSVVYTVCLSFLRYQLVAEGFLQGKWILEEHNLKFEVVADVAGDKWNT